MEVLTFAEFLTYFYFLFSDMLVNFSHFLRAFKRVCTIFKFGSRDLECSTVKELMNLNEDGKLW